MGKKEDIILDYLSDSEVFAALFNGYLFDGRPVIQPSALRAVDGRMRFFLKGNDTDGSKGTYEVIKKERDIVREVVIGDTTVRLAVLGIEHQSEVDYSMVLRTLTYDTLEYLKQARAIEQSHRQLKDVTGKEFLSKFTKKDRLIPTVTLVFYTGRETWDAAMELTGLFDPSSYLEEMLPYIGNWSLNLIHVYDVKDTDKYCGSLKKIFDLLKYVDDGEAMLSFVKQYGEEYSKLDEAARRMLSLLIDMDFYESEQEEEGMVTDVCKALEDIKKMGEREGEIRGEAIGRAQGEVIGQARGETIGQTTILLAMLGKGMTCEEVSSLTDVPLERVRQVAEEQE